MSDKTRSVFIVDDDPIQVQMLKDHLSSKMKLSITTFSTGEDCLNNVETQKPEAVVLDYNLNSVNKEAADGIAILQKIKTLSPSTQVVMLSGQEKIEVAVATMTHGAFDYVIKNESAFVRTENILGNIFKGLKLEENLSSYKKALIVVSSMLILIVILAFVLLATGNAEAGWI